MTDQQLAEHALELTADKARLIYHVLALLHAPTDEDRAARERACTCLERLGYWPDGDRARRMLELGEPGTHGEPAMSRRDLSCIPSKLIEGLQRYAEHGTPVGDFLQAVIANDFRDAACRADDHSFAALTALAIYVYQELPGKCHGSREKYEAWLRRHEAEL